MTKEITSCLDLPIEKQQESARLCGFGDDVEAWRAEMKKSHEETQEFLASLETVRYEDLTPEEQAAHDRWQRKVDSGNVVRRVEPNELT